jgi:hypothetical protein
MPPRQQWWGGFYSAASSISLAWVLRWAPTEAEAPCCRVSLIDLLFLSDLLFADIIIDPLQDQVAKLKVILVQHPHVAIAEDA